MPTTTTTTTTTKQSLEPVELRSRLKSKQGAATRCVHHGKCHTSITSLLRRMYQTLDISFFWGYYILFISMPKKRILYPITITAKKGYGYISYKAISFVKIFASIVTVSEQQKARPGSTAAHMSLTFYRIELKPWSISSASRKWKITAETAETAVLKEKSCLWNPKSGALNVEKRI
jgi:hypothetical protein